jgi:threonine dehydrogenase-like Zn-dependent dehydrogenase
MATRMAMADLTLVDASHPDAQRVAVLEAPYRIRCAHALIPRAGPGQVRVRITWVGVCGSDLEAYRGQRSPEFISTPARLGHEVAGVIDQVGDGVSGVAVGDQVTCRYVWGAFAEYIVCTPFNVKVLPKGFPLEATSLIEILPGVIHAAELARITPHTDVLITGQGVSGLILTQVVARYSPRRLVVTDLNERNLELARRYGATHTYRIPTARTPTMDVLGADFPDGFEAVIPCLLDGEGMIDAVACAAVGGRIIMYGCIGICREPFDFFKVHRKRLEIFSTEPRRDIDMRRFFQDGLDLVLDGIIDTHGIITHRVPLSRIDEAFRLRDDKDSGALHVLVDCEA